MAKQLNVNLAFTADTAQAKAQMQSLQKDLDALIKGSVNTKQLPITDDLMKAQNAAASLKVALEGAFNTTTGKLDITKFSHSMNAAGLDAKKLKEQLTNLGPAGQKAFLSLSQAVMAADVPIRRTNALVSELWTTMKNTARWQLTSSVLHGFMGTISSAVGYAQDLDESLNNIRIVTGNNVEQMAKFAEQANKAAKALSTTTTAYTNAALIYYQQGDDASTVLEKTDVTAKMANVTGTSAEEVSDQLTAIWNNFNKSGEQSYEKYADILTALGAATASSTDEIAGGLEKFASIADMIGLSYEYAASALATITATTRQSEEVVGTALKTIFARIQGLSLGETLEDGTNLNKYSEALSKVGISIFEQNGELKNMDSILDEMGAKWETLSKDQQVALAQTVAGVRQYNQLVSLMDSWDFMEENLDTAYNAEGTLDEQAEIYAESWEAARDRVKAAAENIYDSILDEKFFITLLNGFEDLLSITGAFVDSLNGLPGVLSMIGVLFTKIFSKQLTTSIDNMIYGFNSLTGSNLANAKKEKEDYYNQATEINYNDGTQAGEARAQGMKSQLDLQKQLIDSEKNLSEEEKARLRTLMDINQQYAEQAIKAGEARDAISDDLQNQNLDLRGQAARSGLGETKEASLEIYQKARTQMKEIAQAGVEANNALNRVNNAFDNNAPIEAFQSDLMAVVKHLREVGRPEAANKVKNLLKNFKPENAAETKKALAEIVTSEELLSDTSIRASDQFRETTKSMVGTQKEADHLAETEVKLAQANQEANTALQAQKNHAEQVSLAIAGAKGAMDTFATSVVKGMQGISSIAMGLTSLKGAWDTLNNTDMSFGEKLLSVTMSLSMAIPALISGVKALREAEIKKNAALMAGSIVTFVNTAATAAKASADAVAAGTSSVLTGSLLTQAAAWLILNTAMSPVMAVIVAIVAPILAVVAAAAILVAVFQAIKNSTPEAKLKALQEQADKSAEAFNRVQESVNATKDAIDKLKDSYDVIEQLKEGTEEWSDAISDTNAQVLNLLDQYPDIAKYIYSDNGILKLYQEGYDTIERTNDARLAAANNIKVSDQTAVIQQELNNSYFDFENNKGKALGSNIAKALQSAYDDLGEQLFTQESSDEILRVLQESGIAKKYDTTTFFETIKANEALIKQNASRQAEIDTLKDYQIQNTVASTGTKRSADEIRDLMGDEYSYDTMKSTKKSEIMSSFDKNGWNNYIDYNKNNTTSDQWQMIEDFLSTKGENAKYVGQKGGQMAIEIDGEEYKYSASEFYNTLAELYTAPEYISSFENKVRESLKSTLGNAVDSLSNEELVNIDNFKQGLVNTFKDLNASEDYSNKTFNAMADLYKNEEDPAIGMQDFAENVSYIDTSSEKFINLANAIAQANSEAEKLNLKTQLEDLNAEGQIETMGSYFAQEAESMGLDKAAGEQMHDYARHLMEVDEQSELLDDNLSSNAEAAAEVATSVTRMNKGIDALADGFTDWNSILKKSDKSSAEYSEAINGMRDALSDVLDVESDIIDNDFIEEHLDEIGKAATGDADAIDALKEALAEDVLLEVVGVSKFDELNADIQGIHNKILDFDDEIKVGAVLEGGSDFANEAQKLIDTSKMSVEEAQAYFNSLGYEPEFVTEEQTATRNVPIERTHTDYALTTTNVTADLGPFGSHTLSLPGFDRLTTTSIDGYTPVDEKIQVPALSSDGTPTIKKLTKKSSGAMNNYSGNNSGGKKPGGGGGGGSKPKKATPTKKLDIVDRYKQVEDQLDDVTDAADDASKAMDRLYGKARVDKMREVNKLLLKEVDLLEQKKNEAAGYLDEDRKALQDSVSGFDMSFTFDDKGNISNYQTIMDDLYKQLSDMETGYGDEWDESEQEDIDNLKEKIDKVKEAISQYDETRELMEDIDNEIQEKIYEWQDNNYEILKYELELKLEINDAELKRLEYFLDKYSDNFYKMAESAALMNDKIDPTIQKLEDYKSHKEALDEAYRNGEISQEAYIEGLKEVREGYYDNLEALIELDKAMMHYYGDTLDAASEELSTFTDHMEHLTSVFDHYTSLMEILGKQKDYDAMGNFLGGKADTIRDRLDVAKEYYEMLKENSKADEYWANYQAALAEGNDDMAARWKEQWDAEIDALDEAQAEMLGLTEEWAEAMKAVIENNMNKIAETLEKTLTGGTTFDTMMDEFDKLNTRQEEYLTKTNQIYETNKLMRTANKALDETDNKVAKQKLKNFIDETKSLQENTQLSKYELEIQQAKYDLLLAEIALEEAQNAKSTVRLSQDSEGNFGYVYTADQDAIDNAQQGVEDADNRLYNLSLEGQQEYTEKYLQAQQEMYNELTALQQAWLNGEIASEEEYQRQKDTILNHYLGEGGVLQTYSNLYRIACQTDADAVADNWQTNYGDMTQDTETWKVAVNQYLEDIKVQTDAWKDVSTQANADVEGALNDSETATKNLKDESSKLADTITSKVIPAIDKELEKVAAQTAAYAAQREQLLALIEEYENYIEALNKQVEVQSVGFDKDTDYSALMNEYLQKEGASTSDAAFQELLKQRQAKIDWLKSDEGGNKGVDYWGTEGDETLKMYEALMRGDSSFITGSGKVIDQAWFTKDYMSDEDLISKFETLEIPLGALEDLVGQIESTTGEIKESTNATGEKIDSLKDDNSSKLDDANSKADDTNSKLDDSNSKADDTNSKLDDSNTKADDANSKLDDINSKLDDANGKLEGIESAIVSESGNIQSEISSAASTISSSVGGAISSIQSELSSLRSTVTGAAIGSAAGPIGTAIGGLIGSLTAKFDTGGYTGDWGPEGKLAVLHEKELVLNQQDTSNLLTTMAFLKDIVSMIDSQASMASIFNMSATTGVATNNETLEQTVTIHAEFPNATNHSEIEEAFNNLVNRASQYANRK